jgi:hypothetical protein
MNRSVEKGNGFGATHSVRNVPKNISETFLRNVGVWWQGRFSTERSIPNGMAFNAANAAPPMLSRRHPAVAPRRSVPSSRRRHRHPALPQQPHFYLI